MPNTITDPDRDRIKSLVPSGNTEQIQLAMDNGLYKRKRRKVAEVDEDAKRIVFTATTDTLDRDSERVIPRSFEKDMGYYDENPVVLYGHDYKLPAVGKTVESQFSDKDLKMTVEFAYNENPFAAMLYRLYEKGYMRMTSVGFIPIEWSDDAEEKLEGQSGLTFTRNELIELSLVNIGSNRFALSDLPVEVKSDFVLSDAYARMIENGDNALAKSTLGGAPTIQIPPQAEGLPLHLTFQIPEGKEESEHMATQLPKEHQCPTCQAKADALGAIETKGANLASELNTIIDDGDHDRDEMIEKMADECGMDTDGINAILDGATQCPSKEVIEGLARGCGVTADKLFDAAMQDGCEYDDMDTEEDMGGDSDMDEDKGFQASDKSTFDAKVKFYGMITGMFPESYEERQRLIHEDLMDYLEHELDAIDKYEYVEAYPIATYADHVIVYCWNTDKIYKANYAMGDGEVEFTDLTQIRLNYEEMPIDAKALAHEFTENVISEDTDIDD